MKKQSFLALALLLLPGILMAAQKPPVAAIVGHFVITEEDVNRAVGNRLLKVRTDEYNVRQNVLDSIIDDHVLAEEAARRHMTTDELVNSEIESKVSTPSTADVEPFYQASRDRFGNLSPDEAIKLIATNLRQQAVAKRREEFLASLRKVAGVKVLLEPPRATVTAIGPSRGGGVAAPVTVVEFSDFECPFCSRATSTIKKIEEAYGEKVRFVYRDYPLPSHRGAARAAEAAHCAEEQGKFWEMHDKLYSKGGGSLTDVDFRKYANDIGLEAGRFGACLESGQYTETWKASQAEGTGVGVVSTPTFFVNGRMIPGAAPYEVFAKMIDDELTRAGTPQKPDAVVVARGR